MLLTSRWRSWFRNLRSVIFQKKKKTSLPAKCNSEKFNSRSCCRCGPCQFMAPVLNEVSAAMIDKIQVVKIDTEKYPSIADKYRIEALPTFIIFKDGEPYDRFVSGNLDSFFSFSNASLTVVKIH